MADIDKDEENYLRAVLLLLKGCRYIALEVLRQVEKDKKEQSGKDIDTLLQEAKTQLNRKSDREQREKLFPDDGSKTQSVTWDISLITLVILKCYRSSLTLSEHEAVKTIRDERNKILAHSSDASLTRGDYDDVCRELKNAINILAGKTDVSVRQTCWDRVQKTLKGNLQTAKQDAKTIQDYDNLCKVLRKKIEDLEEKNRDHQKSSTDKMDRVVIPECVADVVLLVGIDVNTGLTPKTDTSNLKMFDVLYEIEYEAHVLSAISATDMVNFFPFTVRVDGYPPECNQEMEDNEPKMFELYNRTRIKRDVNLGGKKLSSTTIPKKTPRSTSQNPKFLSRRLSMIRQAGKSSPMPELPISEEVISTISSFCFPDGLKLYKTEPACTIHFFVLTDISGRRTYATVLTFHKIVYIEELTEWLNKNEFCKDDQNAIYISTDHKGDWTLDDGSLKCYVPQCCVIISKFPYYSTMKECLSSLLMCIESDPKEMITFLKEYANILTHTPVPSSGSMSIVFSLHNLPVTLMPPTHPDKPVIDLPLDLVFRCFRAEQFLKVLSCVLVEERIVFLSSNYSLLTLVMESIMHLILPFKWRFTYSTILPESALAYLESPGTFMYGVHSRNKEEVQHVEGLVLIDIDEGTVQIGGALEFPSLSSQVAANFRCKWTKLKQMELLKTSQPVCYGMQKCLQDKVKRIRDKNEFIANTCLNLMVSLFRDVVNKLRIEHALFDKVKFLEEHSADKEFYERVFKTDMFKIFLNDRLREKTDYWTDLEMKTRESSSTSSPITSRRYTLTQVAQGDKKEIIPFHLPEITDVKEYVKSSIQKIDKMLEDSDEHDCVRSLHYLRALFQYGDGNFAEAMEDFVQVTQTNPRIVPSKVLADLYARLPEVEKSAFKKKQGHEIILDCIEEVEDTHEKIRMEPLAVPDHDLNYVEFEELVLLKQMSNDYRTIGKLFEALTQEKVLSTTLLNNANLQLFILSWEDNRYQCSQVKIDKDNFAEGEVLLKVSKLIKTDFGIGRIGLTDKRVFYLSDVSKNYREVAKLREIRALKKSEHSSLFSKSEILKIHRKGRAAGYFTAHLKEERNWWFTVMQEMRAGKVVAEAMKDVMMVQHAIQNTLLIDAIIKSGQSEYATHSNNVEGAAQLLSYYTNMMKSKSHILPKDTRQALQLKINVNAGERENKIVQTLLYTEGNENVSPRLLCGLSDGRIKVYNAISWAMESEILVAHKSSIMCLTTVDDKTVWAGTNGIYIMDVMTLTCVKKLQNHTDIVTTIFPYDHNRYVYSMSSNGLVIKWNVRAVTVIEKIQLVDLLAFRSLYIHNDRLICASWTKIVLHDMKGTAIVELQAKESQKVVDVESCAITANNEIWGGGRQDGKIYIWDVATGEHIQSLSINCRGISSMKEVDGKIWVGTKDGMIYIFTVEDRKVWKQLKAHDDAVRVLCDVRDRYIISGGGSMDGWVCIWNATNNIALQFADHSDEYTTH